MTEVDEKEDRSRLSHLSRQEISGTAAEPSPCQYYLRGGVKAWYSQVTLGTPRP